MLSCEICEIFKNIYFEEHLQTSASAPRILGIKISLTCYVFCIRPLFCKILFSVVIFVASSYCKMRLLYIIYYFWNIFHKMVQSMSIASYTSDTQPGITCSKVTLET